MDLSEPLWLHIWWPDCAANDVVRVLSLPMVDIVEGEQRLRVKTCWELREAAKFRKFSLFLPKPSQLGLLGSFQFENHQQLTH
jgi:hypothetical protein